MLRGEALQVVQVLDDFLDAVAQQQRFWVGCSRPRTRQNRAKPSCVSACCSALLAAGCDMLSRSAAPVRLPVVSTA